MKSLNAMLIIFFSLISFASVRPRQPIVIVKPVPIGPIVVIGPNKPNIPQKPSADGITNVNNGGGLAEMRLIYLHQNLDRFLQICLTKDDVCKLSNETKVEWQNLVSNQTKDSSTFIISFEPKIENEKGYILKSDQLTISSQMLYLDLETPKKFGQILAYLIAVRQDILGSKNAFSNNLKVATDVFANLRVEESMYRAVGIPALLRIAQLKVSDGTQSHFLFSIEDADKTINLTKKISESLPCGSLSNWNFSQWNSSVGSTSYFYGYANGQCDGASIQKRIVIQVELNTKYIIDEDKISIQFFVN